MNYSPLATLRSVIGRLRTWVALKISRLLWAEIERRVSDQINEILDAVYQRAKTEFVITKKMAEDIKEMLDLADSDDVESLLDNEICNRDLCDSDEVENKLDDRLEDYLEFSQFEEFETSTKETLGEIQDRLTDLESVDPEDVERELDDLITDYKDLDKRLEQIEGVLRLDQKIKTQIDIAIAQALKSYSHLISDKIERELMGGNDAK